MGSNIAFVVSSVKDYEITVYDKFPVDVNAKIHASTKQLVEKEIRLSVLDGLILPHMNMEHGCGFLNEEGRCSIHPYRPSICRLFPLGRYYENGDFRYFLQTHECTKQNRSKVKVQKWIDIQPIEEHTAFIRKWHNFLTLSRRKVREAKDEKQIRNYMLFLLELFYVTEYESEGFFEQFDRRVRTAIREMKHILR